MVPVSLTPLPPSLSHFVIFNPALKPTPGPKPSAESESDPESGNKDLEDDLREAAQILFYTSRESGGVSRDRMLRQVGLAKGLMGFTDMVMKSDNDEERNFYSIHSHRSRLVIYSPEPDFFIYVNIALATNPSTPAGASSSTSSSSKAKAEPTSTAQGLSDRMIVDSLSRGYEDFRLLHSPFPSLLPASPNLSALLDKFWTRFAFAFESTFLSMPSPSPTLLSDWLGGYPAPSGDVLQGVSRAVGVFREDSEVDADYVIGVIGGDGPIHIDFEVDQAMVRFLVNLVLVSLPPAPAIPDPTMRSDARQTLGFGLGRRKDDPGRRSSWSNLGWVPGLSAGTSRNSTPVPASVAGEGSKEKTRWPSLGLGGLGSGLREAMGSVGTALGLGSSPRTDQAVEPGNQAPTARNVLTPLPPLSNRAGSGLRGSGLKDQVESALEVSEPRGEARDPAQQPSASDNTGNTTHADLASDHVQQSSVALPDLRAAVQADSQADLTWDGRSVWVSSRPSGKDYLKRRLSWIIRDNVLLFVLLPESASPPWMVTSTGPTLSLYSKLATILTPDRPSLDIPRPTTPTTSANSWIYQEDGVVTERNGPEMDATSAGTLADLRDALEADLSVLEIYGRTPASRFVVAKRTRRTSPSNESGAASKGGELYMLVGQKDASLTDAEQAVRGFARSHPDFVT